MEFSSFTPLIQEFLDAQDVRYNSKATYQAGLELFFNWLKSSDIKEPTRGDVVAYKRYLLEKCLSSLTVNNYLSPIRQFFSWLESTKGHLNIAQGIRGTRPPKGFRKDTLTVDQAAHLLAVFDTKTDDGLRNYAMVNLMLRTGVRCSEVIWADVGDIEKNSGETVLWVWGKGRDHKDEFVVLMPGALSPIAEYLKLRERPNDCEPLFQSHSRRNDGSRLTTQTIRHIIKKSMRSIGVDSHRVSAHSLRHFSITAAIKAGATIEDARQMARHSDINTTLIYAHVDRIENCAERKVDEYLSAPKGKNSCD